MSSGFSLKIAKKPKKGSKPTKKGGSQKKQSVFGGDQKNATRSKISLTHVERYTEEKPKELIIKPGILRSSLWEIPAGPEENQVKYGLTYNETNRGQGLPAQSSTTRKPLQSSNLRWLEELPEVTNEDEYEEVPVEEFGEALLRGMGWDGTRENSDLQEKNYSKLPHEQGRPLYSGIGAKGAEASQAMGKISESSFMPLVRINRKTGERVDSTKTEG
ncbi:hypothetical protein HG536_0A05020 [Torulaspora globosa]|uniref:Pre-mRNA-splicing factor n=1 Tax=Torulaspora globosa TaxID=48254 RepID=A0A7G3ZB01_9SACH|nr:uncharacterized protein HG536_0A05020 [Torulaspora globosa]QLL30687.1 hypothetical protein HG536_0A05020 [Torulaspora globosa]